MPTKTKLFDRTKVLLFMCTSVLIIMIVMIFTCHCKKKPTESFAESSPSSIMIPIHLRIEKIVDINTSQPYEFDIKNDFISGFSMHFARDPPPQTFYKLIKCKQRTCDPVTSFEIPFTILYQNDLRSGSVFKIINKELYTEAPPLSNPLIPHIPVLKHDTTSVKHFNVKITAILSSHVSLNSIFDFETMTDIIEKGRIDVYINEPEVIRDLFDIRICMREGGETICNTVAWQEADVPQVTLNTDNKLTRLRFQPKLAIPTPV